jgi:glycosyltransferase involved in cell wall biosynthesis
MCSVQRAKLAMTNKIKKTAEIVFVEQFYYPEGWGGAQIPVDITTNLAGSGRAITVLCGKAQYVPVQGRVSSDPRGAGVKIRYVPRCWICRGNWRGAIAQVWFCLAAVLILFMRRRPSLLIVQTNPPLIVVAMSLVASIFRCPLIIIAQDLYPEVMIAHGMLAERSLLGRILAMVFSVAYGRARRVVSLGPKMTARLLDKRVAVGRVCEISNWATGDLGVIRGPANILTQKWGLTGKFVLLYSGNMGVAHDSDTVLHAIASARSALSNLRLIIVGQGGRITQVEQLTKDLGLTDLVQFKPLVSSELMPHALGIADLALVTLLPGFEGLVVPSKLLGHMARGVASLYIGPTDSDIAQLIEKSRGGIMVSNGEIARLGSLLIDLANDPSRLSRMGSSAARYYEAHLSREIGLSRYGELVDRVLESGNQHPRDSLL